MAAEGLAVSNRHVYVFRGNRRDRLGLQQQSELKKPSADYGAGDWARAKHVQLETKMINVRVRCAIPLSSPVAELRNKGEQGHSIPTQPFALVPEAAMRSRRSAGISTNHLKLNEGNQRKLTIIRNGWSCEQNGLDRLRAAIFAV
jgi:hypothetical protein